MINEYKDSPLGKIPKNWDFEKLGKLAKTFAGGTPKRGITGYYGGSIPWIKSGEVNNNSIEGAEEHVTELALKESSAKLIEANSILVAMYGATAGKVGFLKVKACSNQAVLAVKSKNDALSNDFLYHYLKKCTTELLNLCQGSGQPNLSKGIVDSVQIPLPHLSEQKKIAEILSTVDDKIEVIDQQIIETKELKKGLMQRLLTKGIGHTDFKNSPLGEIPKSWEVVELDEISATTRLAGYEYSEYWKESIDGEITALRGYNIGKNKLLLHNVIKISEELSQKLIRSRLFKGNVVFPCVGTIGNAIVIEEDDKYHINQNIAKITPNDNLDPYFLMQYLISPMCKNEIKRFNATTSQPNVLVGSLRKFRIPFPSNKNEQIKISTILGTVDEKLEVLSEKKTQYQELKQGLMQQLLTGKIRVNGI
jgi:type I restriction enzyme, S subunit